MRLDRFIGGETAFTLEHRILNTVLLTGIVITLTIGALYFFLRLEFMSVATLGCGLILGLLYYLSRAKKLYHIAINTASALIFVVTAVFWFLDDGIAGATPFYVLIFSAIISVCYKGKRLFAILAGFIVLILFLIVLQDNNPELFANRHSSANAVNYAGLLVALTVINPLFVVILGYYRQEHERGLDYRLTIEKQAVALEMARLDRLNLVGEMAASIGHEVRNPLTTIRGFLQLYQHKKAFARHRDSLAVMIEELDRANSIISEFLSLAKNKAAKLEPCEINSLIQHLFPLIQASGLREGIEPSLRLGKVPAIIADQSEIRQLVLNLARNAIDAMLPGGKLTIATSATATEALLSVADTGPGIPPEIYEKLGTPFLTNKENGTGLGIPICYRIAERHNAEIQVLTGGAGTTFLIKFPIPNRQENSRAKT